MRDYLIALKEHFQKMDLETRVLITAMVSGTFICFASSIGNMLLELGFWTVLIPFIVGVFLMYSIYSVVAQGRYKFAAYGSLLLLTLFFFPSIWMLNGGLSGSIPYYYIFMVFLSAVALNKLRYKGIMLIQMTVIVGLILLELNYPQYVLPYHTERAKIIDVGSSLVVIIGLVFFMTIYIMKAYHATITQLENAHEELAVANKHLLHASITDELTGLYNRRFIMNMLNEIMNSSPFEEMAVIMIDVDHFKAINDTYGHGIGDVVLKRLGRAFKTHLALEKDTARIGGEEFLMIIRSPEVKPYELIEDFRMAIQDFEWRESDLRVTISAGIYRVPIKEDVEMVLKKVDMALYEAKKSGRNRVCEYHE